MHDDLYAFDGEEPLAGELKTRTFTRGQLVELNSLGIAKRNSLIEVYRDNGLEEELRIAEAWDGGPVVVKKVTHDKDGTLFIGVKVQGVVVMIEPQFLQLVTRH